MKKLLLILLPLVSVLAGCKYDDTEVWDEINAQKARITTLEGTVSSMNSNIGSLQSLVTSVQQKVTVNSVTKTEDGYLIAFSDGNTARINNGAPGKDGKDGVNGKDGANGKDGLDGLAPKIGAKADTDGNYYWTVNGEWLTDAAGKKVSTSNTPKVKIEDDQWMISYDNGENWEKVDGQGPSASCVFETVTTDDENAIFTLGDGTVIKVPLTGAAQKLQLIFDESVFATMRNGELLSTAYKITAPEGAKVDLETFESNGWTVTIRPADDKSGRISIKAPDRVSPTKVLFLLTDDKGGSFVKIISIGVNSSEKPVVQTSYTVDHLGGELVIPVVSSTATIGDTGNEWMEVVSTGDQVVLNLKANESYDWRTARVTLEDGTVITITQITEDALILGKTVINIDGRRQVVAIPVRTNITVSATVTEGSDWFKASPNTRALSEKIFKFTAKRNTSEAERTAKVEFAGKALSATCTINQAIFEGDPSMDVTEAAAAEEGEEVELQASLVVAGTTDGYVISDGSSYLFVKDASHIQQWAGDSVKFSATATTFNDFTALGSVKDYTVTSEKNKVSLSYKDITSSLNTFSSASPVAVKVTGDFFVDKDGSYYLLAKGSAKKVIIYKPGEYTGIDDKYVNHNLTLYGIYYGESNGAIVVIAERKDNNGTVINEGDAVTVQQFISFADKEKTLNVGPALVIASSSQGFLMEQDGARIYVYGGLARVGDIVTVSGKYSEYQGTPQVASGASVVVVSKDNSVSHPEATNITSTFGSYTSTIREFVTFTGTLAISGNYYNITVAGSESVTGSMLKPTEDISSLNGQQVTVMGYYLYHASKGKYLYVIATEINGISLVGPESQGGEGGGDDAFSITLKDKAYEEKAKINGSSTEEVVYKIGTSSAQGSLVINLPAGTKKLSFYAVSWKDKQATAVLLDSGGNQLYTCKPAANNGASQTSPYTLTLANSDHYTYTFASALTSSMTVTLTTTGSNKRIIFYDIKAE